MTEENTPQSVEPVETPSEAPTETLDDIAGGLSVEEQANQFTAQPAPQAQPQQEYEPYVDPYEQNVKDLGEKLAVVTEKLDSYEKGFKQDKVDSDIKSAAEIVNEKLNVDPDMAEFVIDKAYRTDPSFRKIWDNRQENPAALNKALGLVADKNLNTFSVKQDPQIVENLRAAKSSQQTLGTAPTHNPDDEWSGLSDGEFAVKWNKMKSG